MPPPNAVGQRVGDTVAGTSSTGWFTSAQLLRGKTGAGAADDVLSSSTMFNVDNAVAIKAGRNASISRLLSSPSARFP
jgi:hypothetical protein